MISLDTSSLCHHSKQTPKILRKQILTNLVEQFFVSSIKRAKRHEYSDRNLTLPSIQRMHGALLFVDISGFTALSLQLNVDELKSHINNYFSKMLNIVDKYDGDVIKFAGDALYILWPTTPPRNPELISNESMIFSSILTSSANEEYKEAAALSLHKATSCGIEISTHCNNHAIELRPKTFLSSMLPSLSLFSSSKSASSAKVEGDSKKSKAATTVYLNVHSGVASGLFAGLDVGVNDRWEYVLFGKPIDDIAVAEGDAAIGEVVLSARSHELLHPDPARINKEDYADSSSQKVGDGWSCKLGTSMCNCKKTKNDCFIVDSVSFELFNCAASGEDSSLGSPLSLERYNAISHREIAQDVSQLVKSKQINMRNDFEKHCDTIYEIIFEYMSNSGSSSISTTKSQLSPPETPKKVAGRLTASSAPLSPSGGGGEILSLEQIVKSHLDTLAITPLARDAWVAKVALLHDQFVIDRDASYLGAVKSWLIRCLNEDIVKHQHESARQEGSKSQPSR
jgi:class 3 adenylate cyclase